MRKIQILMLALSLIAGVAMQTQQNALGAPVGNTYARADPEPFNFGLGSVDCVGLTDIASVAEIECQLFDDQNCTVGSGTPCATGTDTSYVTPPTFSNVPGGCGTGSANECREFRVTFNDPYGGALQEPNKEWHFKIIFKDENGNPIDVEGKDVRIHSFLVLPEATIGAIALIGASFAAFMGYYIRRK